MASAARADELISVKKVFGFGRLLLLKVNKFVCYNNVAELNIMTTVLGYVLLIVTK